MPTCSAETPAAPNALTEPVHIRQFQAGDEIAFRMLNEEWIVRHFVLEEKDRAVLGDPVKYILGPGGRIVVALIGDRAVGCCALAPEGPGEYEVAKMAVTEEFQGRGIGRRILAAVIQGGRELGASRLYLETNSKLHASRLYESAGFTHVPVERRKASLYARADVFMEMFLDEAPVGDGKGI